MLNYALYAKLNELMLQMSRLTSALKYGSGNFSAACIAYLLKLQSFADEHNLYIAPDVALAIQKIDVYIGDKTSQFKGPSRNIRKEKDAYAVRCLEEVRKILKEFFDKDRKTYEDCSDILRQLLARLLAKGVNLASIPTFEKPNFIIAMVKQDSEMLPYYSHVLGLIGTYNLKALLDAILPQLEL